MTYQNLGFWVGQANDTSTGSHPTGWTSGQRWSETAGEWQTMYGTSQSDLATMTADRNTWTTRANNAWGASRTWNSGPSFESQLPPASPYIATAQFTSSAFQSAANSLANAQPIALQSQANSSAGTWSASTFTVSKSGFYVCMGTIGRPNNDNDRGNQQAHLFWWSNRTGNGQDFFVSWQDLLNGQQHAAYQEMSLLAGDTIQLRMWIVTIDNGVGMINPYGIRIMFVPTAAYPN